MATEEQAEKNKQTAPVKAFHVASDQLGYNRPNAPGSFCFLLDQAERRIGICHACPCGCRGFSIMHFKGLAPSDSAQWDVEGEWPNVTCAPSIGVKYDGQGRRAGPNVLGSGVYHWHGYLERGWWVNERKQAPP